LEHHYWKGNYDPSVFSLGFYASIEEAKKAIEECLLLPGFIEHPEGFNILKHIINAENCLKIWVVDLVFDKYAEDFIHIGIFESKKMAEKYIENYKLMRGDDVKQGEFLIQEQEIGEREWKEGFFTFYYDE